MLFYLLIYLASIVALTYSQGGSFVDRRKKEKDVLIIFMIGLAIFVGLSDMLGGYDRYIYADFFDDTANVITNKQSWSQAAIFDQYYSEQGYDWYNFLVALITENRYVFIFITTIIIYFLLFQSLKDYCTNYPFAIILFLGLWFFFTFTYLRQVMGATIAWLSIRYVVQRKLWKFLLVWYIATKFHNSAYIFLPLYWVPIQKYPPKVIGYVMGTALLLGLTGVPTALFAAYGEVDEERAGVAGNQIGFRLPYMIEAAFFLYLIISKYKEIPEKSLNIVLLNMALIFCAILLFFIRNENGGRLSWYYMIGIIATISYLCTHGRNIIQYSYMLIIVCFFLYVRIITAWGVQLYPYKTFFTDGTRKGDFIEEIYEYDHNYDNDKFYRPAFRFLGAE